MEFLVSGLKLTEDVLRLVHTGFQNVYLLEASHQSFRLREMSVVFLVSGRANEADVSRLEIRLEHVRCIHGTFAGSTCSHEGMDFVYINNVRCTFLLDAVHDFLDALLEIATELRAGQQGTHIELIDLAVLQSVRNLLLFDEAYQSPYQSRLSYTRFAHMQRVVLVASAKHLYGSLQFFLAAYQGVMLLVMLVHAGHHAFPCLVGMLLLGRFLFLSRAFG